MKIEAITVCVNYADFLQATLPQNVEQFDKYVVVTDQDDDETQIICKEHGAEYVIAKNLGLKGKFNKGAAINEGLAKLDKTDWILHMDADVVLPKDFRERLEAITLDKEAIYGAFRLRCPDFESWSGYIDGNDNGLVLDTNKRDVGVGFFQLWHSEASILVNEDPWYPENWGHAGRSDRKFMRKWPKDKHRNISEGENAIIPVHLEHGEYGANWEGRKTPRWGDSSTTSVSVPTTSETSTPSEPKEAEKPGPVVIPNDKENTFLKMIQERKNETPPAEENEELGLDDIDEEEPAFQTSAARKSPFMLIYQGSHIPIDIRDLYRGHSCFLIGGGPSLPKMDLPLLRKPGILTMAMNNSSKTFRPNMHISVDTPARFLESVWRDPTIMKFCGTGKWNQKIWDHDAWKEAGFPAENKFYSKTVVQDCPNVIHFSRNDTLNPATYLSEVTVNWGSKGPKHGGEGGRSVMMAAVKVLYVLGIRTVYLVGTDFRMEGDNPYGFNEQRSNHAIKTNNSTYRKMISRFTTLGPVFKEAGYKIYNCTPGSDLSIFPYMDLEKAIEREISKMPDPETEETYNMYIPDR